MFAQGLPWGAPPPTQAELLKSARAAARTAAFSALDEPPAGRASSAGGDDESVAARLERVEAENAALRREFAELRARAAADAAAVARDCGLAAIEEDEEEAQPRAARGKEELRRREFEPQLRPPGYPVSIRS